MKEEYVIFTCYMYNFVQCREAEILSGRDHFRRAEITRLFYGRQVVLPARIASLLIWRLREADVITGHPKLRRPKNEKYEDNFDFK
jgi:hypothetical protein